MTSSQEYFFHTFVWLSYCASYFKQQVQIRKQIPSIWLRVGMLYQLITVWLYSVIFLRFKLFSKKSSSPIQCKSKTAIIYRAVQMQKPMPIAWCWDTQKGTFLLFRKKTRLVLSFVVHLNSHRVPELVSMPSYFDGTKKKSLLFRIPILTLCNYRCKQHLMLDAVCTFLCSRWVSWCVPCFANSCIFD